MKKLLKSYALDALEVRKGKAAAARPDPQGVLDSLARGECSFYPSVGLGSDLRVAGPEIIGAGLALEDHLLHFSAFANEKDDAPPGRMNRPSERRRNLHYSRGE